MTFLAGEVLKLATLYLPSAQGYLASELGSQGASELVGYTSLASLKISAKIAGWPVTILASSRVLGLRYFSSSGLLVRQVTDESVYLAGSLE